MAGVALTALGCGAVVAASVCVAGVALADIGLRFAWQAWHLVTSAFVLRGKRGRHLLTSILTLPGRRGTYGTGLALVTRLVPVWHRGRRLRLRARRGTW